MLLILNFQSIKLNIFQRVISSQISYKSTMKCNVAVCQFTATNNKETNLKTVKSLVLEAAKKDAKIAFLPEGCDYIGSNIEETKALAEPLSGTLINEYKTLAQSQKIWLSIGGFHQLILNETGENKIYNSHILIDDNGEIRSIYQKIHLFDVNIPEKNVYLKESDVTQGGSQIQPPVSTPAGPLSLAICYDLRFPELSILHRKNGANILTFPSAFTNATGIMHWEVLLRARAIETQCYVIAAAQYGKHNEKRFSYGQSLIIDPWGKIIAECPKYRQGHETNESIAVATIDSDVIDKLREEMPVLEHRRSDIYELQTSNKFKFDLSNDEGENYMFADKVIPSSTVFYRTRYSFAFTNIRCVVPGHVLISSVRRAKRLENLTEEEVADLFQTAVCVQKVMEKVYSSESTTVCVQDGKNAGQTVPHVHVHILPRQVNDFENNDDIYDKLAKHDRDNSQEPIRSLEEMSQEAHALREYFK